MPKGAGHLRVISGQIEVFWDYWLHFMADNGCTCQSQQECAPTHHTRRIFIFINYNTYNNRVLVHFKVALGPGSCNSAPWHCRRLILVSRYMFLNMLSWLEQVSEPPDVHQHQQQGQQHGPEPLQGVTQLPGIIEGWSWCPDICFWPSWVDWNWFQNCLMYTNTKNNANNMVQSHFKV